jgi:excisionase family DNA binding protein
VINEDAYYTAQEAAAVLKCNERTVRRRIGDGTLEAVTAAGKYLIPGRTLLAYLTPAQPRQRRHHRDDDFSVVERELLADRSEASR